MVSIKNNNNNNNKIPNNSVNLHGTRANKIFKNTRDITRNISTRSNGININYKCYDCIKGYPNLDVTVCVDPFFQQRRETGYRIKLSHLTFPSCRGNGQQSSSPETFPRQRGVNRRRTR